MGSFRCSAGHVAILQFADNMFKQPCPKCGVDVFKFRDLVYKDKDPAHSESPDDAANPAAPALDERSHSKLFLFAVAGLCVLALGWFVFKPPAKTAPAAAPSVAAAPPASKPKPKPASAR